MVHTNDNTKRYEITYDNLSQGNIFLSFTSVCVCIGTYSGPANKGTLFFILSNHKRQTNCTQFLITLR